MKTTNISYPHPTGRKEAGRLIFRKMHRALIFITFYTEKLLATKPRRAIFAIPKNDVETAHLEGTDR